MAHVKANRRLQMTRTSTFTSATFAAIAIVSLASTGASAHGGGGSFGGGFAGSGGHGFGGSVSTPGGYAHLPSGIARSSVVPRLVGTAKNNRRIPTQTLISQFPKAPTTAPGNNNKPGWGSAGRGGFAAGVSVDVSADNCLVKQYLPNGRVLFKDLCTSETALAR
jgi:hypothetical protein